MCNTGKRTLQRSLAKMGTRYSEGLDQARFDAATATLQDSGMKVIDVAHLLGHSDSAHVRNHSSRL